MSSFVKFSNAVILHEEDHYSMTDTVYSDDKTILISDVLSMICTNTWRIFGTSTRCINVNVRDNTLWPLIFQNNRKDTSKRKQVSGNKHTYSISWLIWFKIILWEIQKVVNHEHLFPLANVKLSYLASLFIHKVGGIVDHVKSMSQSTGFMSNFLESCGPPSNSFLVDSSPTLSESGGGRTKSELNNTKLESNNAELNNIKSQLKRKFLRSR